MSACSVRQGDDIGDVPNPIAFESCWSVRMVNLIQSLGAYTLRLIIWAGRMGLFFATRSAGLSCRLGNSGPL